MFVRNCWKPHSEEEIRELIDRNPWGLLISNGEDGPLATNLPLLLERTSGNGILSGHLASANEHSEILLKKKQTALAVFQGPYSYVTASWYPNRDMPSTYYYTLVHCYGSISIMSDQELLASLEELTQKMESQFENGWTTGEIPASEITRRLKHIVGFKIHIDRFEAKFKLGQDEPRKDALSVAHHLKERSQPEDLWLADAIRRYNEPRPSE